MDVLKQLTKNLMKGLTLSHISLPIKIFEPRSSIQRIVDIWSFAPKYLKEASESYNHLERLKLVIAFALSGIYICSSQFKPFNPILGETLQAQFEDGTKIFCEHTSHHPPITNFHMQGPNGSFEFWGNYEFVASLGANSLKSGLRGPNNIRFADGHHIRFKVPDFKLGGTVMGERSIEATGNVFFEDLTNNYKAVVILGTYHSSGFFKKTVSGSKDEYKGLIYECEPILNIQASARMLYSKKAIEITKLTDIKDLVRPICEINGSWLKNLVISNKVYWDIERDIPARFLPCVEE